MSAPEIKTALLLSVEEDLRQKRETFNQRKKQEAYWFALKLSMGCTAAVLLPAIAIGCGVVLLRNDFSPAVVNYAGAALFVEVLGLLVAVWKLVLNPGSITRLEPTTSFDASEIERLSEVIDRLSEGPQTPTEPSETA